jgi:hypothetical protein
MLFVDNIRKIVKLGIASSYLKDEETYLNILLVANPEAGKTSILLSFDFSKLKNVYTFTDMTKSSIQTFIKKLNNPKEELKYVILPDLVSVFSHGKDTRRALVGLLNVAIEEGVREVSTYISGLVDIKSLKEPVKFGLATGVTKQVLLNMARYWRGIGFISRLLPVSYDYTKEQIEEIREYIASSKEIFTKKEVLKLKPKSVECDKDYVLHFEPYINKLSIAQMLYGFRYTRQFRIMLKANALLRGSDKVTDKDVEEVERLMKWVNLDFNKLE